MGGLRSRAVHLDARSVDRAAKLHAAMAGKFLREKEIQPLTDRFFPDEQLERRTWGQRRGAGKHRPRHGATSPSRSFRARDSARPVSAVQTSARAMSPRQLLP